MADGESILSAVSVSSKDKQIKASSYRRYVRQEPNSRWFNMVKVPLGIYCLSGTDSTKKRNRFIRKLGEPPVIYDSTRTSLSKQYIKQALYNKGFLHAHVESNVQSKKKKTKVAYHIYPGQLYTIRSIRWVVDNPQINEILQKDSAASLLRKGMPCDVNLLEQERKRIFILLQNKGYYKIHKEFVSFQADTCSGCTEMDLEVRFRYSGNANDSLIAYKPYHINRVKIYSDVTPGESSHLDSTYIDGMTFYYQKRMRMKPEQLKHVIGVRPGDLYSEAAIQSTYSNTARVPIIQYGIVRLAENEENDSARLDCSVFIKSNSLNTIGTELEGTNTAGDLGAAASLSFSNRNLFRGGEVFTAKIRGAYEAITGLEGYSDQNYIEISTEANLTLPRFFLPFASSRFRRSVRASTEFSFMYDSQNRPEFHRRVLTGAWRYKWNKHNNRLQHRLDLLSLNYVFMPWISDTFKKNYLDSAGSRNSVLRYSYENLFIMRLGYNMVYNSTSLNAVSGIYQTNAYQIRFNVETAGNLLYGLSKMVGATQNANGQYTLINDVAYAQYAKLDFDYAKSFLIDERNSIAFHFGLGLAFPYGNAQVVPYEKRYFSGGANSVRGWSVRELGPGSFSGKDGAIDFINQTGDLKLDLNLEYRTYLFWKLHGALFIDAGNIWTLRRYEEQPGGQFRFDEFYKQIALSYGLGFRLNFDYFILRFDMGMKAINPAYTDKKRHYPLISPNMKRDFTFHFAVGLPF